MYPSRLTVDEVFLFVAETSRNIVNGSLSGLGIENGKQIGQNLVTSAVEYKMPLVWIDMEMTGKRAYFYFIFYFYLSVFGCLES